MCMFLKEGTVNSSEWVKMNVHSFTVSFNTMQSLLTVNARRNKLQYVYFMTNSIEQVLTVAFYRIKINIISIYLNVNTEHPVTVSF